MTHRLDLQAPEYTDLFLAAPIYRKHARVHATQVTSATMVHTVLADGSVETSHWAVPGEMIITNPGGEQYVVSAAKFYRRYKPTEIDGVFEAIGRVHAFRNPTGLPVVVTAPLGDDQYGDADCILAMAVELPSNRYIIGIDEFNDTYVLEDN